MSRRQASPADGCKATKEDLFDSNLKAIEDCPNCKEDWNVLCRVSNHPSRQQQGNLPVGLLYFTKGNEIYDFWCAVVKPDAVVRDSTGKKLRFKDGLTRWGWTRDVDELYVRDCYTTAIQTLGNVDIAMLEGTPGVGKSLFIFYLIYKVVFLSREQGQCIPTFLIADRDGTGYFLSVDLNGNGIVRAPTTETPDYLITDTRGRSNPSFTTQYIHVSSINNSNVKDVRKLMDQGHHRKGEKERRTIYLPGFSVEEYLEIDGFDEASNKVAMNFYYDVFGGSLRNLRSVDQMAEDEVFPIDIYDVVQAEMVSFFGGHELSGIPEATWNKTAKALAKKLLSPNEGTANSRQVDPNTISRSIIMHWSPSTEDPCGWRDVPATRFMRHLAGHICDSTKNDALSRLKNAIGPSGMGYVHEHDAHQFRLTHLTKAPGITLWSLQGKEKMTLCLPIKRVVRIRTVSDIERLEEGDYGLPTVSNFPFIDAVMKPCYLFQDTLAQDRHSSVAKIPDILKALEKRIADVESIVYINTLGTDNFNDFKMNGSDVMRPFSQWKTRMEVHTDDMALVAAMPAVEASEGSKKISKRRKQQEEEEVEPKRKKSRKGK
eukprot:gene11316-12628_t